MADSTAPRDFLAESVREHMSLRTAMLEKLCEAQFIAGLRGWKLVETRSLDGLRTTWHFEHEETTDG